MTGHDQDDAAAQRAAKYGSLPPPVRLEDTFPSEDTEPPPDPRGGRDTDLEFMLRNAGG